MNNQQAPTTGSQLLDQILAQYTGADAQGIQNKRAFDAQVHNNIANVVTGQIKNGVDGVPIDPNSITSTANNAVSADNTFDLGLVQNLLNSATSRANNATDNATQQREQNLKYGIGDQNGNVTSGGASAGGSDLNGQQAEKEVTTQNGKDLLDRAGPEGSAQRYLAAQQILAEGGVGAYRKKYSPALSSDDESKILSTNQALQSVNRIQSQLKGSKAFNNLLNNPLENKLAQVAVKSGQMQILKAFGLSDDDVQALGDLVALNAKGDTQLIGGKLSGYLSSALGPAQVGIGKSSGQNQKGLDILTQNLTNQLNTYAKGKGFASVDDIPGLDHSSHANGSVMMKSPDGKTFKIDSSEVDQATQNGWKKVQ